MSLPPSVLVGSVWEEDYRVLTLLVLKLRWISTVSKEAECLVLHSTNRFIAPGTLYHPRTASLAIHYTRIV